MAIHEELIFITSMPIIVNCINKEDRGIYSRNLKKINNTVPGQIVSYISRKLFDILQEEKAKGKEIEIGDLASSIDKNIEIINQYLIEENCDYFITKEFHSYVYINRRKASITFLSNFSAGAHHENDDFIVRQVQNYTRATIDTIFSTDDDLCELYKETGEALLYIYSYNIINKKSPLSLYFPTLTFEEWMKKNNLTPKDLPNLCSNANNLDNEFYDQFIDDESRVSRFLDEDPYYYELDQDYLDFLSSSKYNYLDPADCIDEQMDFYNELDGEYEEQHDDEEYYNDEDDYDDDDDLPELPWN